MATISAKQICDRVQDFWNAFCSKSGLVIEKMYLPEATAFTSFRHRSEPARLMLARRLREFGNQSSMSAELGPVDAQIAGDVAIASYSYHFRLLKNQGDGNWLDLDMLCSRASQVFQLDQSGTLRILHEHLSLAEPPKRTLVPSEGRSINHPEPPLPALAGLIGKPQVRASDIGPSPGAEPISVQEVQRLIHREHNALQCKRKDDLEALYSPRARFLGMDHRRSDLASLAIMRNAREYFGTGSSMFADLGPIDVQMAGDNIAIATYTFQFHSIRQLGNGKRIQQDVPSARATAVLLRDEAGTLQIFHEHLSAVEVGTSKELEPISLSHP